MNEDALSGLDKLLWQFSSVSDMCAVKDAAAPTFFADFDKMVSFKPPYTKCNVWLKVMYITCVLNNFHLVNIFPERICINVAKSEWQADWIQYK